MRIGLSLLGSWSRRRAAPTQANQLAPTASGGGPAIDLARGAVGHLIPGLQQPLAR